jgi:3-oxoadipate enol-lactonase
VRRILKIRINNADIAYDDHGVGQPLLFLHAFPLNRSMWQSQVTGLLSEGGYRLVAPDWRGFGESESSGELTTMEMLADDVAALMDALGMQQALVCGLSLGGYVAFAFLRKYPERVRGLVLADTKPDADTEEGRANRERIAQLALSEGSGAVAELQVPKLLSEYTRQHHPEVEARVRRIAEAATGRGIAAISRGMAQRSDAHDVLAQIAVPTLVLVGEQDAVTPPKVAQEYAEQIPGAQFVVIPQAGHLANLEQPEAFFEALQQFLVRAL